MKTHLDENMRCQGLSMGYEEYSNSNTKEYITFSINSSKYYSKDWQTFSVKV